MENPVNKRMIGALAVAFVTIIIVLIAGFDALVLTIGIVSVITLVLSSQK